MEKFKVLQRTDSLKTIEANVKNFRFFLANAVASLLKQPLVLLLKQPLVLLLKIHLVLLLKQPSVFYNFSLFYITDVLKLFQA